MIVLCHISLELDDLSDLSSSISPGIPSQNPPVVIYVADITHIQCPHSQIMEHPGCPFYPFGPFCLAQWSESKLA